MRKILKPWWAKVALVVVGMVAVAWGLAVVDRKATGEQVAKIHATKLTMDDVMGTNLPPDPGVEADKTIEGIDANENGIRDDVELAIFKEYPDSAKTRAVLLQYALALQMEMVQTVVNRETVDATADYGDKSNTCVADTLVPRESPESSRSDADIERINSFISFIKDKQLNTPARKKAQHDFYQGNLRGLDRTDRPACDMDVSLFRD